MEGLLRGPNGRTTTAHARTPGQGNGHYLLCRRRPCRKHNHTKITHRNIDLHPECTDHLVFKKTKKVPFRCFEVFYFVILNQSTSTFPESFFTSSPKAKSTTFAPIHFPSLAVIRPASSKAWAVPIVGWPANGNSFCGVKIRT